MIVNKYYCCYYPYNSKYVTDHLFCEDGERKNLINAKALLLAHEKPM